VPSKDPIQRFTDILENIVRIEEFTAGMDVNAFVGDAKTYDAVERCLETNWRSGQQTRAAGRGTLSGDSVGTDTRRRKRRAA
jgi:hypothetical protein